ncbi:hypothetical protein BH24GEM1_BH24GEM1_22760 [soil metagenome]
MTPNQFAAAVGADPKWVQNAARILGRRFARTAEQARWVRLVHLLHQGLGVSLARAGDLASEALSAPPSPKPIQLTAATDDSARIAIDLARFDSSFVAALGAALAFRGPKQRGQSRWSRRRRTNMLRAAEAHGVDLNLVRASLALPVGERLRRLDENAAFLRALRT